MPLQPPQSLTSAHDLSRFQSGNAVLDDWLKRRSLANEVAGASRTYVIYEQNSNDVIAYYSLAVGSVIRNSASSKVRRNMPDPIPVMILGRLAVDESFHGKGIGRGLVRDAILRTQQAAKIAGIRAILVHAIDDKAREFYEHLGFQPSPISPLTLMLPLSN